MSSSLDIANMALAKLGEKPINSFIDGTTRANTCAENIQLAMDYIASIHPWRYCTLRIKLVPTAADVKFGYKYEYRLPNNLLQIFSVYDSQGDIVEDYQVESGNLVCDSGLLLQLRYVKKEKHTTWNVPPYVALATGFYLADLIAATIQSKADKTLMGNFTFHLSKAKAADSRLGPVQKYFNPEDSSYVQSRY